MIGLPKMDGCASLLDVNLESCKAVTADGLDEFCAYPPPALQKLNLSYTNLKSKCRRLHVVPMLHFLIFAFLFRSIAQYDWGPQSVTDFEPSGLQGSYR